MSKRFPLAIFLLVFLAACNPAAASESRPLQRATAQPAEATQTPGAEPTAEPLATAEPTAEPPAAPEPTAEPPAADAPHASDLFSKEMLANMTYSSAITASGQAPLSDGRYREPENPQLNVQAAVALTNNVSFGDLNGQPVGAAVLVNDSADDGSLYSLHIVGLEADEPLEVASIVLENGVQIDTMFIANNQVVVELLALGVQDSPCCPTDLLVQIYQLQGDELLRTANEVVGALPGTPSEALFERVWTGQDRVEPLADSDSMANSAGQYFLILNEDGTYEHTAACSDGGGRFTAGVQGNIRFRPFGEPFTLCESLSGNEDTPETLDDVVAYRLWNDMLSLIGASGSTVYTLSDGALALPAASPADNDRDFGADAEAETAQGTAGEEEDRTAGEPQGSGTAAADYAGSVFDLVTSGFDLTAEGAATTWQWRVRPDTEIAQEEGGGVYPGHLMITFDNENMHEVLDENGRRLLIYPLQRYVDYDEAAGRSAIGEQTGRLEELIASAPDRQAPPQGGMPLLPPPNSLNEPWTEFQDLDFADGQGVRYVSGLDSAVYTYQGLTADGRYYISLWWPLDQGAATADLAALDEMVGTIAIGQ